MAGLLEIYGTTSNSSDLSPSSSSTSSRFRLLGRVGPDALSFLWTRDEDSLEEADCVDIDGLAVLYSLTSSKRALLGGEGGLDEIIRFRGFMNA